MELARFFTQGRSPILPELAFPHSGLRIAPDTMRQHNERGMIHCAESIIAEDGCSQVHKSLILDQVLIQDRFLKSLSKSPNFQKVRTFASGLQSWKIPARTLYSGKSI
jgi:hypothetical protein